MHEIVVLSGKGGAGKTSVTAALARAMSAREKIVVCDYDVDAPDLHILLKPETEMRADFVSGHLAVFNSDNCIDCARALPSAGSTRSSRRLLANTLSSSSSAKAAPSA